MWADDPTGAWKKRAEEERAKRGLEDAAAKAPTPAPEPAPAPAPEPEPEPEPGAANVAGGQATLGPAWTRGEIEAPAGEKSMGTHMAAVYTEEQQARLGVTETGEKVAEPEPSSGGHSHSNAGLDDDAALQAALAASVVEEGVPPRTAQGDAKEGQVAVTVSAPDPHKGIEHLE